MKRDGEERDAVDALLGAGISLDDNFPSLDLSGPDEILPPPDFSELDEVLADLSGLGPASCLDASAKS